MTPEHLRLATRVQCRKTKFSRSPSLTIARSGVSCAEDALVVIEVSRGEAAERDRFERTVRRRHGLDRVDGDGRRELDGKAVDPRADAREGDRRQAPGGGDLEG